MASQQPRETNAPAGDGAGDTKTPVRVLIPVWGTSYIQQFCLISLPTLLAPGNLPALASEFDCEVIFLTRDDDKDVFLDLDAFKVLEQICPVSFVDIRDLIVETTYAVTITMAYVRGMRSVGDAMLDTYFIYLVSDYVMAEGSLRGLGKYIKQGYSGIQAGNFQAMADYLEEDLADQVDKANCTLTIPPRQLMQVALENLHPITVANMVDNGLSHATHANRFFWRVDRHTLLGRFFLMHMLCIRPETDDFQIGSSCDYSFIPEMCPSGNITAIEDSDDYLVVELQPKLHEEGYLRPGPYPYKDMVDHFSEWTNQLHRDNADYQIVFHADDVPGAISEARDVSDNFIHKLKSDLKPQPQPVRGHPYWLGAVDAFKQQKQRSAIRPDDAPADDKDLVLSLGEGEGLREARIVQLARQVYQFVMGEHPFVQPWHHAWHDYKHISDMLRTELEKPKVTMIAVSERNTPFSRWLSRFPEKVRFTQTTRLLTRAKDYKIPDRSLDAAFIYLYPEEFKRLRAIVLKVTPLIRPGGKLYVHIDNGQTNLLLDNFLHGVVVMSPVFFRPNVTLSKMHLNASALQIFTRGVLNQIAHRFFLVPVRTLLMFGPLIPVTYMLVLLDNLTRKPRLDKPRGLCSSASFAFNIE